MRGSTAGRKSSQTQCALFLQFVFEERVKVNNYLFERAFFNSMLISIFCQPLGH